VEETRYRLRVEIDSISVSPDTVITTTLRIADAEKALATR
jgi:phosphoenolpyruvate synthase/pyruvate phosphate dikinase